MSKSISITSHLDEIRFLQPWQTFLHSTTKIVFLRSFMSLKRNVLRRLPRVYPRLRKSEYYVNLLICSRSRHAKPQQKGGPASGRARKETARHKKTFSRKASKIIKRKVFHPWPDSFLLIIHPPLY